MTTATQALAAIRTRLTGSSSGTSGAVGSGITIALRFHGDPQDPLPDTPTPFAFIVFNNDGSRPGPTAFGGGPGANLYRNRASVEAYVFSPRDQGLNVVMDHAETIAARLRSFRDSDISCFSADVIPVGEGSQIAPPGMRSDVSNYQCAVVEVVLHFDQIG